MNRAWASVLLLLAACGPTPAQTETPEPAPTAEASPDPAAAEDAEPAPAGADPSVNDSWRSDDIDPLVERLEGESREIFVHREKLVEVVAPKKGATIADIGSGSGFMSLLFAKAVGEEGKVLSVDINQAMLDRLDQLAEAQGSRNIETMVSEQAKTPLAPESVDLVFICDTYHHFESPATTMASIHTALREGGELVLTDFERIPGKTSERMMQHVRAGKDVFTQEVLDSGFELVKEHDVPELVENYVLRFRKVSK